MRMSRRFNCTDDISLVKQVEKYPILYHHNHADYRDMLLREVAWGEIATEIGKVAEDCKTRWRNIRDNYNKIKKRLPKSSGSKSPKWGLYKHLLFLDNKCDDFSTLGKAKESPDEDEELEREFNQEESRTATIKTRKQGKLANKSKSAAAGQNSKFKKKKLVLSDNITDGANADVTKFSSTNLTLSAEEKLLLDIHESENMEEDEIDLFMRSITATVKRLPPHLIPQAKLNILSIVTNLQLSTLTSLGSQAHPHSNIKKTKDQETFNPIEKIEITLGEHNFLHSSSTGSHYVNVVESKIEKC
ncbi:uncharacterized protein LOC132697067 [Cylas formicarius]|uniref:uncharacterized protein LOC132697067 n=1 Tax=Cylas formicarius TaxID=197179 RepID=UPI002958B65A|nr:uncharacterized protein LOC132697067 [Cylas formicarius]XP_060518314.1 uncharacterized protein LOC132697067 [Cylas formicarius]